MKKTFMKLSTSAILFLLPLAVMAQTPPQDLERLFKANPGLTTQANPEILRKEATRLLGKAPAERIYRFMKGDLSQIQQTRMDVILALRKNPSTKLRRVVVSGQSVTGLMTAAIAAQSGHMVDVYDLRMNYVRGIQWSSRQSVPDSLAAIDPALADKYIKEVAEDLTRGYTLVKDGTSTQGVPPGKNAAPDPRRIPLNANEMLNGSSVSNVQTREMEKMLYEYLSNHPNVRQHKGKIEIGAQDPKTGEHSIKEFEDVTPKGQKEKVYKQLPVKAGENPIVVIAEGAGSSTRQAIGIKSIAASPVRLQTAGTLGLENGGIITTLVRNEKPGQLLAGSIGVNNSNERWLVTDIEEARITPGKEFGTDVKAEKYVQERARLLELEFKRIAELNMQLPKGSLAATKVTGAIGSGPLATFELQQHLSSTAFSGNNVILAGDAVGNGHWSVGGGMHVGVVSHPEEFRQFLTRVDGGEPLSSAVRSYAQAAMDDTSEWVKKGLHYFYDSLSDEEATKAFNIAKKLYNEGKVDSYYRAIELQLPEGRKAIKARPVFMRCDQIPLQILGDL